MILIVFCRKSPAYSHLFSSIFSPPLIALALQARHVFPFPLSLSFSFLFCSRCNHKSERRKRPIKFLFAWELEVERSWCRDGERSEWRRKWARGKKREKRSGTEEVRTKEQLSNELIPVDSPSIILNESSWVESPSLRGIFVFFLTPRLLYSSVSLRCAEEDILSFMPKQRNARNRSRRLLRSTIDQHRRNSRSGYKQVLTSRGRDQLQTT